MSDLRRLLALVVPHWPWLALGGLLGVIAIGSNVALMGLSAYLISKAAIATSVAELALAITGVRVLAISRAGFRYLERYTTHRAMFRILTTIRAWFYAAVEPLAPARLVHVRSGDLMTRLVNDVDAMEEFYVRVLVPPFVAAVVVTITSAIYGLFDALMGLLLLAFLVLTGVVLPLASRWLSREPARMVAALRGDTGALIVDGLLGAADLVALDADGRHRQRLLSRAGELDAARRRLGVIEGVSDALGGLFAALAGLCILVLAIPLVTAGEVEGVFLAALPLAAIAAFEAVQPLSRSLQLLDTTRASARRLFEIVDTPPPVTDAIPSRRPPEQVVTSPPMATDPTPPAIDIRGLSFRYAPDEPWVLRDVDLHIGAGERVALVGPSGCGKSTLLALLLRFWDYEQGSLCVAGHELREMGQDVVRAGLAVVPQDIHLFDATIRDNLAVADGDASDAEMEAACRIAQLHDAIAALPAGYDTVVGENGVRLSGGERRRLAIARAILKGAPVVVLDEATADLDATTQAALWTALDPWLAGRTVLVMAHEPPNGARVGRVVELRPDRDCHA
ncbi:MAG TPA: thiol reductant ABC exporter subunit CydC [Candidatus Deferrimicrobium sp.]|nr:thiol reductant ABC exporter subunit CydC [Candidatus Deferrimicrobium sp.]